MELDEIVGSVKGETRSKRRRKRQDIGGHKRKNKLRQLSDTIRIKG